MVDQSLPNSGPDLATERGSALLWALLFTVVTSGLVLSHTTFMTSRRGDRDARYNRAGMADTFARSGLQDTVGWFHGLSNQPITVFDPVHEPHGTPPRIETIDASIGMVREFEINGSLWGRYEIRREDVVDISSQRGDLVPGSAWEVGVRGYVYRRRDPDRPFDTAPNQLVGTKAIRSEIRWLQINPPAAAAICATDPGEVNFGRGATVDGRGSIALAFLDPAAAPAGETELAEARVPTIHSMATILGVPTELALSTYDASPERVFSMRLDELRSYSDVVIDSSVGASGWSWEQLLQFLRTLLTGSATGPGGSSSSSPAAPRLDSKLIVTRDFQLAGQLELVNSLLVIDGNLTTKFGQNTKIEGIVYVLGDALLDQGTFELDGALIVHGETKLGTGFLARTTVRYDAAKIEKLRRSVGKYRSQRGRSGG